MNALPIATLANVDKFVESQMRALPLDEIKGSMFENGDSKYVPRFTVDGYGKWREVKGEQRIPRQNAANLKDRSMLDIYSSLLHTGEERAESVSAQYNSGCPSGSKTPKGDIVVPRPTSIEDRPPTNVSCQSYKQLSTSLRSNVVPGLGKDKWDSSMQTDFTLQSLPPSWVEPGTNFGYTRDAYMKWAEHDVYRQRLVKAWDKYITNAPKPKRQGTIKHSNKSNTPKEERNLGKQKNREVKKTAKERQKNANNEKNVKKDNTLKESEFQTRKIEVQPINTDESFWDFYEKPFAQ